MARAANVRVQVHYPRRAPQQADWPAELLCPSCGARQPVEAYRVFGVPERFRDVLNQVVSCPTCRHTFAPTPSYFARTQPGGAAADGSSYAAG